MQDGQLEAEYAPTAFAASAAAPRRSAVTDVDVVTALFHHLNHRRAAPLLPAVLQAAHAIGAPAVRLLKLLVHALFTPALFTDAPVTIARGAFAVVQQRGLHLAPGSSAAPVPVAEKVRRCRRRPCAVVCCHRRSLSCSPAPADLLSPTAVVSEAVLLSLIHI